MKKTYRIAAAFLCIIQIVFFSGCGIFQQKPFPEQLNKPTSVAFNPDTLTLSWDAVPNAKQYNVSVSYDFGLIKEFEAGTSTITFESSLFSGKSGNILFSVNAVGYDNFTDSKAAGTTWYRVIPTLGQPVNIEYSRETGLLSWEGAANAEYYSITCTYGNFTASVETAETGYNFSELKEITPLNFSITAMSDNVDLHNSISAEKAFYIQLADPKSFSYNRSQGLFGTLVWAPVPNAVSYEVFYEHTYRGSQSGLSSTHRSPSSHASVSYYTVTMAEFLPNILYTTNPLGSITFYVKAKAAGYASSPYIKYVWTAPQN